MSAFSALKRLRSIYVETIASNGLRVDHSQDDGVIRQYPIASVAIYRNGNPDSSVYNFREYFWVVKGLTMPVSHYRYYLESPIEVIEIAGRRITCVLWFGETCQQYNRGLTAVYFDEVLFAGDNGN